MSSFDYEIDESLKKIIAKGGNINISSICKEAVEAAKEEAVNSVKNELNKHRKTGSMEDSVKASKIRTSKNGASCDIGPTGKDKDGTRNMEKAMYLEYGTSKMAAKPWRKKAISNCEDKCKQKMKEVIDKKLKK